MIVNCYPISIGVGPCFRFASPRLSSGVAVIQTIGRTHHVTTSEGEQALERWDTHHSWRTAGRPTPPWWDCVPTGAIWVEIGGWSRVAGATHGFVDTRTRKVEARLDDILVSLAAIAAGMKIARGEAAERARAEEPARAERARLAHLSSSPTPVPQDRGTHEPGQAADFGGRNGSATNLRDAPPGGATGEAEKRKSGERCRGADRSTI